MGFRQAVKQWYQRVYYHCGNGFSVGSVKRDGGYYYKVPSLFYSPGAENTDYKSIQSNKGIITWEMPTEKDKPDNIIIHYSADGVDTPKPQRRWNIFINFLLSPFEILTWVGILIWQTGKFIFQTLLWNAARHVVGPFILSLIGVTLVPIFQSIWSTVGSFYKALGRAQNVSRGSQKYKKEGPSGFWGWLTFLFFLFPLGIVVGAVRGLIRTVLMLTSKIDQELENWELLESTSIKPTSWMMLPQLFTAIGDWFESIANHLNNFIRLVIGDTSIGSIVQETISFIFNLPAMGLKLVEMCAVRVAGLVLALVADIFVFWSWANAEVTEKAEVVQEGKALPGLHWFQELWCVYVVIGWAALLTIFSGKSEPQAQGEFGMMDASAAVEEGGWSQHHVPAPEAAAAWSQHHVPTPAAAAAAAASSSYTDVTSTTSSSYSSSSTYHVDGVASDPPSVPTHHHPFSFGVGGGGGGGVTSH